MPLKEYVRQLHVNHGSRILRQEPVAVPAGRAVLAELSNDSLRSTHVVFVEVRPGVLGYISSLGLDGADLVEVTRSLRVDVP